MATTETRTEDAELAERRVPRLGVSQPVGAGPERPIRSLREDRLGRDGFIRRLYTALVNETAGTATGVVIGVTGPWGSGKSSLLNILHEYISEKNGNVVVIRFDPWMVSGRHDLIDKFFAEFIGTLKGRSQQSKEIAALADLVAEYAAHLTPVAAQANQGFAPILSGALKATQRVLAKETSLYQQRQKLSRALDSLRLPIVVLIDELDRIDDTEIRTIAQIVRSVADFPAISYVLAYDAERVIQALGGSVGASESDERGRAYLEKIVQLQVPLPITLPVEIHRLFLSELIALENHLGLPENWSEIDRFRELVDLLVPAVIGNPRDVKRLTGTFHAVGGMVRGEVDWVGLLGFCALLIKAPTTVENIRRNPDAVVEDPESAEEQGARIGKGRRSMSHRLAALLPEDEASPGVIALLGFLFPVLADAAAPEGVADAIHLRMPLWKTLRLGMLPEDYSRAEVALFARSSLTEMKAFLRQNQRTRGLDGLLTRLGDLYVDLDRVNHAHLWEVLSGFAEKTGPELPTSFDPTREYARSLAVLVRTLCARSTQFRDTAKRVFQDMVDRGDMVLPAHVIRYHMFAHGAFGKPKRGLRDTFLTEAETVEGANFFGKHHRTDLIEGKLLPKLVDLVPVFNMLDTGHWNETCKAWLTQRLHEPKVLDAVLLWFYGGWFKTERAVVEKLVDLEELLRRMKARSQRNGLAGAHETVRVAYKKAEIQLSG